MKRESFDFDWMFGFGKPAFFGYEITKEMGLVDLPHDYTISSTPTEDSLNEQSTGYYNGGRGYYRKSIFVPSDIGDKITILAIDGAYANSEVSVNDNVVSLRPYGYSPYNVDLTEYLVKGKNNEIRIVTDNTIEQNSRWYTGSGLYRHVDILTGGPLHIKPWGIFATTEEITGGNALPNIETTLENMTACSKDVTIKVTLHGNEDTVLAWGTAKISMNRNSKESISVKLLVENAILWDTITPNLYNIVVELMVDGEVIDRDNVSFGIRTITANAKTGLLLNGKSIKLKGGCIHHDNGIIGSRANDTAEYRKVKLHKDNGYNALRCAHNPPSRGLLNACDKLGVLVIDEAFDMWNMAKNPHDYHMHFMSWWERDLEAVILRDRNHPCIIMWSIGNEIPERGGLSSGAKWSNTLAKKVRTLDESRFVTQGICGIGPQLIEMEELTQYFQNFKNDQKEGANTPQESMDENYVDEFLLPKTEGFCSPMDIVGYNYLERLYEKSHEVFPNRIICGTESFPTAMDTVWNYVEKLPYVIGDFTWTSFDYIGEAGIGQANYYDTDVENESKSFSSNFPWRLSNCSDFDICGFERPQLSYRRIVWGSKETFIAVRNPVNFGKSEVLNRWGWPDVENIWDYPEYENCDIEVDVYSAAEEVELFANEVSVGKKRLIKEDRFTAKFQLKYNSGTLKAVSYIDGKVTYIQITNLKGVL